MKKKKINGLFLNKKTISKLNSSKVLGGVDKSIEGDLCTPTKGGICPVRSERGGPCGIISAGTECQPHTLDFDEADCMSFRICL